MFTIGVLMTVTAWITYEARLGQARQAMAIGTLMLAPILF